MDTFFGKPDVWELGSSDFVNRDARRNAEIHAIEKITRQLTQLLNSASSDSSLRVFLI